MQKIQKYFVLLCSIVFAFIIFIPLNLTSNSSFASNGVLDLSNYNFSTSKNVELNGKWELYYDQLLSPDDLKHISKSDLYYSIPGRLCDQIPDTRKGYMTLHLKVNVPHDEIYGLYINSMFTASDIWINGENYGGHGKVGKSIDDEQAIYRPIYLYFPSSNKEIDIVIQTSVYRDIEPHLNPAILGTQNNIIKLGYLNVTLDGIAIGILFIMFVLNLGFYFAKHRYKKHIYFSAICSIIFLRCLVFNSTLLNQFIPTLPFEVGSKIAAITFYLWITFYILFLNDIFNNKIVIKNAAIIGGLFLTVLCLLTPSTIYDHYAILAQCITIIFACYLLVFLLNELKQKNINAKLNFFPFVVLCLTALNDFLVNNSVISRSYSAIYGGMLFVLTESLVIIIDYFNNVKKLDDLDKDGLTSLYNNGYIKDYISKQIEKYNTKSEVFSLIMIDIDNFKSINDNYGHLFGDKVIVDVANIISYVSVFKGCPGRFGGDEFILILPNVYEKEALSIANEIVKAVSALNKTYEIDASISVSIGVYENGSNTLNECLNNVDSAMYFSKSNGKNQVSNSKIIV